MQISPQGLNGKVALVTGSAQRIGAHYIRSLHASGAKVIIHYRGSAAAARELQKELESERANSALCLQADLCQHQALVELVEQSIAFCGKLDILVNNASSFYATPVGEVSEDQWDDLLCSNLKAPFFLAQAAAPALKAANGVIINMVDIHGQAPYDQHPVYSSAKAGLIMLTRSLAKELAPNIRVNAIAPGSILWPEGAAALSGDKKDAILAGIPLQRQGSPEDLTQLLLFLVSDAANYISGQIVAVDGGRSL